MTDRTELTEQRLRSALASRADRTEPADDALDRIVAASSERRAPRRWPLALVAAAALLVVVAVAVIATGPESESVDITDEPTSTTTSAPEDPDPSSTTAPTTTSPTTTTTPATTTSTAPPSTTTASPTTTAPPPVPEGASTDPVSGSGTGDAIAYLAAVRSGAADGYERVVLEFHDGVMPDWAVRYVDPPITQDGSGEPVAVAGEAFLLVTLTPSSAVRIEGETVVPTHPGGDRIAGPGGQVVELVRVGDYEAVLTWAIGLRTEAPFRVTTLTSPTRLIIDIATP